MRPFFDGPKYLTEYHILANDAGRAEWRKRAKIQIKYFSPSFLWSYIFQGYISDTLRYIFCAFFALKTDSMDNMRSSKYIFL